MRPVIINKMEENKLILEFLNTDVNNDGTYELPQFGTIRPNGDFKTSFTAEQTKFHKDWNWIMEVVEKIEGLNFTVEINKQEENDYQCLIVKKDIVKQTFSNTKIVAVYNAVVEFINYYNANK